jgi:hypothetical protein
LGTKFGLLGVRANGKFLLKEFEAEFFDDGVGEDVAGDLLDFLPAAMTDVRSIRQRELR